MRMTETGREVRVALVGSEYLSAMHIGCMRRSQDRRLDRKDAYGASADNGEALDILGAVGEACVAKYLNQFWLGLGTFRGPDVSNFQVRTRSHEHYDLILHPKDNDDDIFILVYASKGVGLLSGWLYGREGKKPEYWKDPSKKKRFAYFVPKSVLHGMDTLPTESLEVVHE